MNDIVVNSEDEQKSGSVKKVRSKAASKAKDMVQKPKKSSMSRILLPLVRVIALAGIGSGIFFYTQYQDAKDNPSALIEDRNAEESDRVISKLQSSNPDFYSNAQAGDYLVLFPARAIVYREQSNQIVNVAPIINTNNLQTQNREESN